MRGRPSANASRTLDAGRGAVVTRDVPSAGCLHGPRSARSARRARSTCSSAGGRGSAGGVGVDSRAMRAVGIPGPGGPEVLTVIDRDVREPGPGEVRLAVAAAAVNPTDIGLRMM